MTNNLQITVTTNVQRANSSLKQLQQTLQGTGNVISRVGKIFDKEGNLISKTIVTTEKKGNQLYRTIQRLDKNGTLRNLSQSITEVKDETDKSINSFLKLKNIISFGALVAGVRTLSKSILETTTKAIDYSESLNLFNVVFDNIEKNGKTVFSEVGKQATEFQEKLQSNFGTNRTESMYYQGLYQAMANAQGIADKYANIMSENSTKLTYDLSSLFNSNQNDTAEALRAGIYAGQTKPLRSYGIDITETSLQATLDKMKQSNEALRDLQVSTMSQAEKQILRYLSVLEQASVAHGDFANTIDSPANQLKIFQNQIIETGVAVGNLFIGPLQKLLTFANTVVIVVKQVAQAIASLFGIKIKDYNTGIASATNYADDLADSYDGVGGSAGRASKKLKELNRQALAFDNINNINENKGNNGSSGSGSGGVGTGINQALLDALKGYDNGLDKVRLKAQKVADQIMKWLGFTYDAEEGVWKLGKAYNNLIESGKRLGKTFDILNGYTFINLINFYQNFLKPVASWTLGIGLPRFLDITSNGILKTDWDNLNNKLNNFYKALTPFSINIGEGLLWFYEKILVPLGSYTIGKVVPEFIQLLANGITILNNTIDTAKPFISFFWDNFLSPIAKWTGGVAVDVLKDINSIFGLISKSKVASTVTALGSAFLLVKANGGLVKTTMSLLSKVFGTLEKDTKKTSDNLSDSKSTGLGKILSKLKTIVSSTLSPVGKLVTSIKNASKESGDFVKKSKESGSILDLLKTKFKNTGDSIKGLGDKLKNTKTDFKDFFTQMSNGIRTWQNTTTGIEKFKTALVGIGGTVASLQGVSNSMKDIAENGANVGNVLTTVTSGLGSVASGAMTGASALSAFGPYGAIIGGVAGGVGSLITAITSYNSTADETKNRISELTEKMNGYKQALLEAEEQAYINAQTDLTQLETTRQLSTELETLIDSNGKVKNGYEDRVNYILNELNDAFGTEYQLIGNTIYSNGQLISSYEQIKQSIEDVIAVKKGEIILNQYESVYYQALQNKIKAENDYAKEIQNSTDRLNEAIKSGKSEAELTKIRKEEKNRLKKAQEDYEKVIKQSDKTETNYHNLQRAVQEKNAKGIEDSSNKLMGATGKNIESLKKTWDKTDKTAKDTISTFNNAKKKFDEFKDKQITIRAYANFDKARAEYNRFANDASKSGAVTFSRIPAYANGGFPEEGPFYMNRGELAGKFSNGKSVVANNQQITTGIKMAVMEGMSEVMKNYGGTSNVQVDVRADKGFIVETAIDGINRITDTTGDCPVRVM